MKNKSTTVEKKKPGNITGYINSAPEEARKKLREMRSCLRKTAPGAQESLRWGIPAFSHDWILFQFAAFKHHIGFYPTPSAVKAFEKDLKEFKTSTGAIQFPLDKPLPLTLIRKIAEFRVRESNEKGVKWMSSLRSKR